MADMISRAAAVRALASSNGDYLDALERFERLPAVDAIPVEWFKNRRDIYLKAYHAGHESELRTAAILNDILQAWQQEQEAKDGKD